MVNVRNEKDGEINLDKLPEGVYFFTGQEGFVKVEVDNEGKQTWDLHNWFASLDPDKTEAQNQKIIQDIKRRINADTGIINPPKKLAKRIFTNLFKNK
tara:strand:- start:293 stop:586 length:294 start_codon:yes stop_codon:yes gene_type:complete